ncbi:MAG: penicillin-binding protein 2 [Candidatus Doudnabacteria bacterium]
MVAKISAEKIFKQRMVWLTVFFGLSVIVIVARLAQIQILSHGYYVALADNQRTGEYQLQPVRGEIKIQDSFSGQPYTVATASEEILVYVNASEVEDLDGVVNKLAEMLQLDSQEIRDKISDQSRKYVILKKNLPDEVVEQIKEAKLVGVHFDKETSRFYPEQTLLAQLLGFVGYRDDKLQGSYGLELAYEKELAGIPGTINEETDASGRWIFGSKRDKVSAVNGDDLILTIDKTVQLKTESILKSTVEKHGADSGSVVVMDPKTGAIIAMANYPSFNLNEYSKVDSPEVYVNQTTVGAYEPGSIFKPLTIAAAVNEGKINAATTYVDTGEVKVDEYTIKNSDEKAHGVQTVSQILEESLNTGTIFAKNTIGNTKFLEYVKRFGFGEYTGIEVAESAGNLANLKGNIQVNYHTASFGQGILVTPIQMVRAFSALANNGKMASPYLVEEIVGPYGDVRKPEHGAAIEVISPKTASEVSAMLVNVVEKGHGKAAAVPGYYVAGKTGTAQVAKKDGSGYQENNNIGSFIGYAPVEDPKFVMIVRINHPRTVKFAESTAAPAFGEIAQFLLQHYHVIPTRTVQK